MWDKFRVERMEMSKNTVDREAQLKSCGQIFVIASLRQQNMPTSEQKDSRCTVKLTIYPIYLGNFCFVFL